MKLTITVPDSLHGNTSKLVASFAEEVALKLYRSEQKYCYTDDWKNPALVEEFQRQLVLHQLKGDPLDVAAYCAFLWHHKASTAGAASPPLEG